MVGKVGKAGKHTLKSNYCNKFVPVPFGNA